MGDGMGIEIESNYLRLIVSPVRSGMKADVRLFPLLHLSPVQKHSTRIVLFPGPAPTLTEEDCSLHASVNPAIAVLLLHDLTTAENKHIIL